MNKTEFVSFIAKHSGISKADAERSLKAFTEGVLEAFKKDKSVNLIGFGTFKILERKAREGRNPKTGQKMRIAAYRQPSFKAGKKLKEASNKK